MKQHVLITGGSSGIGLEAAKALASDPDTVVVVGSRTAPNLPNVEYHPLDLADQDSVREFAEWYPYPVVDAFIACAGVQAGQPEFVDGIELTFATNHLGHALLFFLLNSRGVLAPTARIIFVGSSLHDSQNKSMFKPYWTTADVVAHAREPDMEQPMVAYPNSKLANTLFTYALDRRAKAAGKQWGVNIYDPGFVPGGGSRLHRNSGPAAAIFMDWVMPYVTGMFQWRGIVTSTAPASGQALARLATHVGYAGVTGKMFRVDNEMACSKQAADVVLQDDLWDWTVDHLKIDRPL